MTSLIASPAISTCFYLTITFCNPFPDIQSSVETYFYFTEIYGVISLHSSNSNGEMHAIFSLREIKNGIADMREG